MSEKPDKIVIRCENCKRESSLTSLDRHRGICSSCQNATWHIQTVYLARQDDGDAASLTLKALGFGIFTSEGERIQSPIPGEKRPINGFDIHDVSAETMMEIASTEVNPQIKLMAFVKLNESQQFQQHREEMKRNGQDCEQCGVLFVVNEQKPWTLVGTCSKVCCATKFGSVDYTLIEQQVMERCESQSPGLRKSRKDQRAVSVVCTACNHQFEMPRIYIGVHRKCPACGSKVLIKSL